MVIIGELAVIAETTLIVPPVSNALAKKYTQKREHIRTFPTSKTIFLSMTWRCLITDCFVIIKSKLRASIFPNSAIKTVFIAQ